MSGPAIVLSARARSAMERPRHPLVASVDQPRWLEGLGTRPIEGRNPTTLHEAAGLRREPPESEPLATGTIPQASATAAPPEEPPQVLVRSYGLWVAPKTELNVWSRPELGDVGFSEEDGTGGAHARDEQVVVCGDVVFEEW